MEARFGESFWNISIIGVSHWAFDSNSIFKRNITGHNEDWYLEEWNKQLKEKFNPTKDLPGVFIDAMSQLDWIEDLSQQEAFKVHFKTKFLFQKMSLQVHHPGNKKILSF